MPLTRDRIKQIIQSRDLASDSIWQIFQGADEVTATQVLNEDDSVPYLREVNLTNEMLAFDADLRVSTEIYRLTLVLSNGAEPDTNGSFWISSDGGTTKERVNFSHKRARNQRSFWWLFFKKD